MFEDKVSYINERIADGMYDQRDAYVGKIDCIMELYQLDEFAATVLAFHINGMGPRYTALKLNVSVEIIETITGNRASYPSPAHL